MFYSDTEIRMLRNTQKEIKRDSSLTGDVYMMKAKLRSLQEQLENSDNKISALRNEVRRELATFCHACRKIFQRRPNDIATCSQGSLMQPSWLTSCDGFICRTEANPADFYCHTWWFMMFSGNVLWSLWKFAMLIYVKSASKWESHFVMIKVISRDKNLTNRQKEIVDLRLELRKFTSQSLAKPEDQPSVLLSPGARQRPIQVRCMLSVDLL